MTTVSFNPATLGTLEPLHLDQHFHPYGLGRILGRAGTFCEKGPVHTFQVLKVIANYTPRSCLDLSFLFYRIWNAIKAVFGRSDWQKTLDFTVETAAKTSNTTRAKVAEILDATLALNWQEGHQSEMSEPTRCNLQLR